MPSIPHVFHDPRLVELALTHSSSGPLDNERLEFLGDSALDLVVAEELYQALPDVPEGELTERKAWVVSRPSLARAALQLRLDELARVGRGLAGRTLSRSVLANLYEAVLGAVYLDAGLDAARRFVLATLDESLARARHTQPQPNPKKDLQELCQRRDGEPPVYVLLESRGRAHARAFLVRARAAGREFPSAWGRTRKEAERWAAHEALLALKEGPA